MSRKLLLTLGLTIAPLFAFAGNPVENSYGVKGSTSGTVTIRTLTGTYDFNLPATAGSSGSPLLSGGGSAAMTWGSRSGDTTTFATTFGALTSGHCPAFDVGGNIVDSGSACGGTITGVTAGTGLTGGGTSGAVTINLSSPVSVLNGGTGLTAGTSGGILAYTASGTLSSSGVLTANAPVIGGGAGAVPTVGSRSGNTTTFGTTTGTLTSGHCVAFDSNGNLADAGSACGTGSGSGTVTSVGLSLPAMFTVSGSPVVGSGTLTGALATQTANTVLSGPTTGSAAAPTFRALVAADIPTTAVSAATYGDATHVGQFTVDGAGRLTAASNVTITGAAPTGSAGGALAGTFPNPTLATQAANTVVANATGSTAAPTAVSVPSCADTGGNHLNYISGTGFSCGATSGSTGGPSKLVLNTTAVGNGADTTEDNAQSYTMPAGTFTSGWIEVHASGTLASSSNNRSWNLYVGSTIVATQSTTASTVFVWHIHARIYYVDATHQFVEALTMLSGTGLSSVTPASVYQAVGSVTNDTAASIVIKTTVRNATTATANSVTSSVLLAEMFP